MSEQPFPARNDPLDQLAELLARRIAERLKPTDEPHAERSPWMNIDTAAAYLDWPKQRLYKLAAQGAIPHYKHDGRLLFNRGEIDHWLRTHAQPAKSLASTGKQSY